MITVIFAVYFTFIPYNTLWSLQTK